MPATISRRLRLLAFSDLHRDLGRARLLVERSPDADVVVAAGDFASVHRGLDETIAELAQIETPTVLVPGNNETEDALRKACAGWDSAIVLHGEATEVGGVPFFGLGAGVPITPWDWSFDLSEEDAGAKLSDCPERAVLVAHSPPMGHCDRSSAGEHLGSHAILAAIEAKHPSLALCGHIHESWGTETQVNGTRVMNLGPSGVEIEISG
jgi:Icc-related predicted phosphoesterase